MFTLACPSPPCAHRVAELRELRDRSSGLVQPTLSAQAAHLCEHHLRLHRLPAHTGLLSCWSSGTAAAPWLQVSLATVAAVGRTCFL